MLRSSHRSRDRSQPSLRYIFIHIFFFWPLLKGVSVVDPNTLKLDPDPEFWPNLDPYPGLCYKF